MATPDVADDEVLYRQIGHGGDPLHYDPARTPPIHRAAFLPSPSDSDGLSLIRREFRTAILSAQRIEQPDTKFRLAQLTLATLKSCAVEAGLSSLNCWPSPDALDDQNGEPWAHCFVKEINRTDYEQNKTIKMQIKTWAEKVSQSITLRQIVDPFQQPAETDPYRPQL